MWTARVEWSRHAPATPQPPRPSPPCPRNRSAAARLGCSDTVVRDVTGLSSIDKRSFAIYHHNHNYRQQSTIQSSISSSCRVHDNQANHIIVRSCKLSSFQTMLWFCSRNSPVNFSHRAIFFGLTKSTATLIESAKLAT